MPRLKRRLVALFERGRVTPLHRLLATLLAAVATLALVRRDIEHRESPGVADVRDRRWRW